MITLVEASLALFYSGVGVTIAVISHTGNLTGHAGAIFLSVLWLGFVLAISFMEAWVKFRAPFLPRHLGLDVGRTVFRALISVEMGLCLGLWLVMFVSSSPVPKVDETNMILLILLTILLLLQVFWWYPRLELRGKHVIYENMKNFKEADGFTLNQRVVFDQIHHQVIQGPTPSILFHLVYVLGELVKVSLLLAFAFVYLKKIPQ